MITAQEHTDQLFETFRSNIDIEKEMFHVEGLVFDEGGKLVRLSDELNMGSDFSNTFLEYRYRLGTDFIDVVSIFRRTSMTGHHEEPYSNSFILSLKNQNNNPNEWCFEITDEEINNYVHRFLEACNSIEKEYDTIILVPSSHEINRKFMDVVFRTVDAKDKVEDLFYRTYKSDAYASRDLEAITRYCEKQCDYDMKRTIRLEDTILEKIDECFEKMKGVYFKPSDMDQEYVKFIRRVVTPNNKYTVKEAPELIRDKHVLVLDDTLLTGSTISSCTKNIRRYGPSKMKVITILSDTRVCATSKVQANMPI